MSYIEISRENFFYNLNQIAARTQSPERIALVLKDNAYGHGLLTTARLAAEAGVRHAVVRRMAEAEAVAELFETVLVLSDLPAAVPSEGVRIAVNDRSHLAKLPPKTTVELKIDTGMHRNGISPEEAESAVEEAMKRGLEVAGIMTHYRSADEMGSEFFWQKKRFEALRLRLEKGGLAGVRWHSCNSAALFRQSTFDEDIARIGIAAYGCLRMPSAFKVPELRPVMRLWAERLAKRKLAPGERIGYGGEGELPEGGVVSTYDLGYGDGWPRGDAENPYPLPDGRRVRGRVSMDMLSVDGSDGKICLFDDARVAAAHFGTIAYEILVKLSPSIPRIVV